mgnify:CR=1 FL=1
MTRIRDFGIIPGVLPTGTYNAITDVPGVRVGHTTINRDVDGVSQRTGSTARDSSGEIIVAFATGNILRASDGPETTICTLVEGAYDGGASPFNALFTAAIEATEEAVYNALVSAITTPGVDRHVLEAIAHDRLRAIMRQQHHPQERTEL